MRIYWNDKFLEYPLHGHGRDPQARPGRADRARSLLFVGRAKPKGREDTFEQWVSNRFGSGSSTLLQVVHREALGRLDDEIRAEWAAQRIKGLSFFTAAKAAFFGNRGNKIKSLISEFNYPRYGPGQMWEQMTRRDPRPRWRGPTERTGDAAPHRRRTRGRGRRRRGDADARRYVISSLPLRETVGIAEPEARSTPRRGARAALPRLPDRGSGDRGRGPVPRQLDLHPRPVGPGRADPELPLLEPVDGPQRQDASMGMEYFCFEGDQLWTMADEDLVNHGDPGDPAARAGQRRQGQARFVVRVHKAYPIYDADYAERVHDPRMARGSEPDPGRTQRAAPLQQLDHSMLTAMRAVDNILLGAHHDIWAVNAESVYHEEDVEDEQPYREAPETPAMEQPLAGP